MRRVLAIAALSLSLATGPALGADLRQWAEFGPDAPPGNVAVGPDGRVFMSLHGFFGAEVKVAEVSRDGTATPYPPEGWGLPRQPTGVGLNGVLGLRVDREGVLWLLDAPAEGVPGRLVGWDTTRETLHQIVPIAPPAIGPGAFLNDLAVDRDNEAVYIADTATPDTAALLVVDLKSGGVRRVLEGSPYTRPEDLDMVIDGRVVTLGDAPARIGVNPITIDPDNDWVYFAPMTGTSLYRARTRDLLDADLPDSELRVRVERFGDKPISDGITVDAAGNVYITDITNDAIGVTLATGRYQVLHQRDDLSWPDGFASGPDGRIYVTVNELHRSPVLAGDGPGPRGEFKIMSFKPLAAVSVGR